MEYISAEEFMKQPKEVQKVFINWWQPKLFDLIHIDYYSVNSIDTVISEKDIKKYGIELLKKDCGSLLDNDYKFTQKYLGTDLLQAYWKVAVQIAKEC